jgi:ATP-dependent helicase HepA
LKPGAQDAAEKSLALNDEAAEHSVTAIGPEVGGFVRLSADPDVWSVQRLDGEGAELEAMERPGVIRVRHEATWLLEKCDPPVGRPCFALIEGQWVEGHLFAKYLDGGVRKWNFTTHTLSRIVDGRELRFHTQDFRRDPADALGHWIVDTPGQFELRRRFLDELNFQRALTGGCTALMASKVEIYEHQVEIVARVLEDPIHRFILADEVGLGKTIEAGLILRQRFLDGRAKAALVIVPNHLRGQWESELQNRFGLPSQGMAVRVATFSDLLEGRIDVEDPIAAESMTDLIVDEAHHAAAWGLSERSGERAGFEGLATLASRAEGMLLLSATPQETTSERLLALLELLDPALHSREHLDRFQLRVDLREAVLDVLALIDDGADVIFYSDQLEEISEGLEDGTALRKLIDDILKAEADDREPDSDQLSSLRTQFRETFRLHNRLIRSSRSSDRLEAWRAPTDGSAPGQHLMQMVRAPRNVEQRARLDEIARDWMLRSIQHQLDSGAACALLSAALFAASMGPEAMRAWVDLRQGRLDVARGQALFGADATNLSLEYTELTWEHDLLTDLSAASEGEEWFRSKVRATHDAVRELGMRSNDPGHVVVFTSTPGAVDRLEPYLTELLEDSDPGRFEVLALGEHVGEHEVMDASQDLYSDPVETIRVVIAGPRVEEGANFQGAHRAVHYDIPRNLSALEQRVGRLDRIGQSKTIQQVVLLPRASDSFASQHVQDVLAGFGVLSESISGVQGGAEEHLRLLDSALLDDGAPMDEFRTTVREELRGERKARERERELDQAAVANWRAGVDFSGLIEHERGVSVLERTASQPLKKFLGLVQDHRGLEGSYRRSKHATADLNPSEEKSLGRCLGNKIIPAPGTFDRKVAARQPSLALRRTGDPLIDWAEQFFLRSGRGAAYALIRFVPSNVWRVGMQRFRWPEHAARWVFSFEVAPRVEETIAKDHVRIRRFMPRREAIVLLGEGDDDQSRVDFAWAHVGFSTEPQQGMPPLDVFNLREQPYKGGWIASKKLTLTDHPVLPDSKADLDRFVSSYDWDGRVRQRATSALDKLRVSSLLSEWREHVRQQFESVSLEHERILRMRSNGEADEEAQARQRILAALYTPMIRLQSAGFVVLTGAQSNA